MIFYLTDVEQRIGEEKQGYERPRERQEGVRGEEIGRGGGGGQR